MADLPRLYVPDALPGPVALAPEHVNYLRNVLRLAPGDPFLVFNGRDGEWRAVVREFGRRGGAAETVEATRPQTAPTRLTYAFAPLKQARLDYMVEKAAEMGADRLVPVLTQHGQVRRINRERLRLNAVEACEQCGVLTVPDIDDPVPLGEFVGALDRPLVVADEALAGSPADAVAAIRAVGRPLAVLVGPEGGWSEAEREMLVRRAAARVALGPRVLRADTAAVALLALVEAALPS